jgi:hypothetical protein
MTTSTKPTTTEAALVAATGDGLHLPNHDGPVLRSSHRFGGCRRRHRVALVD